MIEVSKELPPANKVVILSVLTKEKENCFGEPMYTKWITRGYVNRNGKWFWLTPFDEAKELKGKPWRWCVSKRRS